MDAHSNYNRSVVAVCSNKHTQRLTLARHPKIIKIKLYDMKMCENESQKVNSLEDVQIQR